MTGDAWEAFKESIKTSGIIEPIVVTKDMIIVSGHQRVRAAKNLVYLPLWLIYVNMKMMNKF